MGGDDFFEDDRSGAGRKSVTPDQGEEMAVPANAEVRKPKRKTRISSAIRLIPDVEVLWNEPLSRHTTFRVGGPVFCFARPRSERGLAALLREAREREAPWIILGGGSNVLPPDGSWDAMVIHLGLACRNLFRFQESGGDCAYVYMGAGAKLSEALQYCISNELGGLEPLAGIPGTIGGALVMNAGTAHGDISEHLLWIDLIDQIGRRQRVPRYDLSPGYRTMGLPGESVVIGACFKLGASPAQVQRAKLLELLKHRKQTQPLSFPSAGCIFKNPPGKSAGELIDKAGLKGLRMGDAEVSRKHANWIVNRGGATARDILALIGKIENEVLGNFGVRLEREIRILGH